MKKYWIITSILLSSTCFASNSLNALEGTYVCYGTEPGSKKSFKCDKILKKTGETYTSITTCNDDTANTGTGIYDKKTHRLSLAFVDHKKPEESGVAIEELKPNGRLIITYAYLNKHITGSARCTKKRS